MIGETPTKEYIDYVTELAKKYFGDNTEVFPSTNKRNDKPQVYVISIRVPELKNIKDIKNFFNKVPNFVEEAFKNLKLESKLTYEKREDEGEDLGKLVDELSRTKFKPLVDIFIDRKEGIAGFNTPIWKYDVVDNVKNIAKNYIDGLSDTGEDDFDVNGIVIDIIHTLKRYSLNNNYYFSLDVIIDSSYLEWWRSISSSGANDSITKKEAILFLKFIYGYFDYLGKYQKDPFYEKPLIESK